MVISRACALAPVRNFVVSASEKKRLKKLDVSKASGPDGLSAKVLRQCASVLAKPLTRLYSLFFKKGIPEGWKTANVVPVHKKTKKSNVENYRPISVIQVGLQSIYTSNWGNPKGAGAAPHSYIETLVIRHGHTSHRSIMKVSPFINHDRMS